MAHYARSYHGTAASPGWTGAGNYPGAGYRTAGYHVRDRGQWRLRYDQILVGRPRGRHPRAYDRVIEPRGLGFPRSQPQYRGPAPRAYAADYHGGGFGPSYYTGGMSGRTLGHDWRRR